VRILAGEIDGYQLTQCVTPINAPSRGQALDHGSARLWAQPTALIVSADFPDITESLSGASPHQVRAGPTFCLGSLLLSASICVHLRLRLDQGFVEHFIDGADGTELEALFGFRGYFFQVFFVGFGEEHHVDAGA
jgi:hypothetical protein